MPEYDEEKGELTFPPEASEANHCPLDGAALEYGVYEVLDDCIRYPWVCPECGAAGTEYAKLVFDGHVLDINSLSDEIKRKYTGIQAVGINGVIQIGDLVMVARQGTPFLIGTVTNAQIADEYNVLDADYVTIDCRQHYGDKRTEQIQRWLAYKNAAGGSCNKPGLSSVVIEADNVLRINNVGADQFGKMLRDDQSALWYAFTQLQAIIRSDDETD